MKLKIKKGKRFIVYLVLKHTPEGWIVDNPEKNSKFKYLDKMPELTAMRLLVSQGYQCFYHYR